MHENMTSKVCNFCLDNKTEFIKRDGKNLRGLLTCKKCCESKKSLLIEGSLYKQKYQLKINRDLNGSLNILEILRSHILYNERPHIFKIK